VPDQEEEMMIVHLAWHCYCGPLEPIKHEHYVVDLLCENRVWTRLERWHHSRANVPYHHAAYRDLPILADGALSSDIREVTCLGCLVAGAAL
jgi:hypothetical protein